MAQESNRVERQKMDSKRCRPPRSVGCRFSLVLLLSGVLAASGVDGQVVSVLEEACGSCEILVRPVAVFGDVEGEGMIEDEDVLLDVGPDRRFFLMSRPATRIQVFDDDGTVLRSIGRVGDGPGEFRWAQALHLDDGGRLFVVDRLVARISIFDPELILERTVPLSAPAPAFEVFAFPGDSIVLSGYDPSPERLGAAAHVLAPDGSPVRSFGEPRYAIASRGDPFYLTRTLELTSNDELWVAGWSEFQVERWSLDGDRLEIMGWNPPDFQQPSPLPGGPPPPRPALVSVQEDASGLLWLAAIVPGAQWAEAFRPSPGDPHGWTLEEPDLWMDVLVAVIDPQANAVLATSRFERGQYSNLFGERLIGQVQWDAELGTLRVHVKRLELAGWNAGF